jgi:hypothetical protein
MAAAEVADTPAAVVVATEEVATAEAAVDLVVATVEAATGCPRSARA